MNELLPCPFCGGEYTQVRYMGGKWQEPSAFESGYRGECCDCHVITAACYTEAEAIAAWNTRAQTVFGMTLDEVRQMMKRDAERERTCHRVDVNGYSFRFECSACGYVAIVHNCESRLDELPNHCPSCGAKVVSE